MTGKKKIIKEKRLSKRREERAYKEDGKKGGREGGREAGRNGGTEERSKGGREGIWELTRRRELMIITCERDAVRFTIALMSG